MFCKTPPYAERFVGVRASALDIRAEADGFVNYAVELMGKTPAALDSAPVYNEADVIASGDLAVKVAATLAAANRASSSCES